jgi:UDP-glucose 4-epimerase
VFEVLAEFERVNGARIPYKIAPRRVGDLPTTFADVSKAERLMGWKAELPLAEMCRVQGSGVRGQGSDLKSVT